MHCCKLAPDTRLQLFACFLVICKLCNRASQMLLGSFALLIDFDDLRTHLVVDLF